MQNNALQTKEKKRWLGKSRIITDKKAHRGFGIKKAVVCVKSKVVESTAMSLSENP